MKTFFSIAVTLILLIMFTAIAVADMVDFNNPQISDFQTYLQANEYAEDGYYFDLIGAYYVNVQRVAPGGKVSPQNPSGVMPAYDSVFLGFTDATQPRLKRADGQRFNLLSMDIGTWLSYYYNEKGSRPSDTMVK